MLGEVLVTEAPLGSWCLEWSWVVSLLKWLWAYHFPVSLSWVLAVPASRDGLLGGSHVSLHLRHLEWSLGTLSTHSENKVSGFANIPLPPRKVFLSISYSTWWLSSLHLYPQIFPLGMGSLSHLWVTKLFPELLCPYFNLCLSPPLLCYVLHCYKLMTYLNIAIEILNITSQ